MWSLLLSLLWISGVFGVTKNIFGRYGSVKVDYTRSKVEPWGKSWPEAINLNDKSYMNNTNIRSRIINKKRLRTYQWIANELYITCNMTALANPSCTRLIPPLPWISTSDVKVKINQRGLIYGEKGMNDGKANSNAMITQEEAVGLFRQIDVNNDGRIDSDELTKALEMWGIDATKEDITYMIESADKNEPRDNMIDLDEWKTIASQVGVSSDKSAQSQYRSLSPSKSDVQKESKRSVVDKTNTMTSCSNGTDYSGNLASFRCTDDAGTIASEGETEIGDSIITIEVPRELAEQSLSSLRRFGFKREDMSRILDKGSWVLAFEVSKTLPKLFSDLEMDLGMTRDEARHIISHCPYLIAQYSRYRGRDVSITARVLRDVGYFGKNVKTDIMRFPSVLAAPPDRLRGWSSLLEGFGVNTTNGLFGNTLKRAPFMFNVNPPYLLFMDDDSSIKETNINDVSTTASDFTVSEALKVLQLLASYDMDMDKVVRSNPSILTCPSNEVHCRLNFLMNLYLERKYHKLIKPTQTDAGEVYTEESEVEVDVGVGDSADKDSLDIIREMMFEQDRVKARAAARASLRTLLQSNPNILSIEYQQMRRSANTLLRSGIRKKDVIELAKRYPQILNVKDNQLGPLINWLKTKCFMKKSDVKTMILRFPAIVELSADDIETKVDYLYKILKGTPRLLTSFPRYLSYDLDKHILPRTESLRAIGADPVREGLPFVLKASTSKLAERVGVAEETFENYVHKFEEINYKTLLEEKASEEARRNAADRWEQVMKRNRETDVRWAGDVDFELDLEDLLGESDIEF